MPWRVTGGTAVGSSHVTAKLPCQDRVAWQEDPAAEGPVRLVAALADGAGSAPLAEVGAETAVRAAVEGAPAALTAGRPGETPSGGAGSGGDLPAEERAAAGGAAALRAVFGAARDALAREAAAREVPLSHLATTLAVALVTSSGFVIGQIGDGVLAVRLRSGEITGPAVPQRGEYANEATFLTSGEALPELSVACFGPDEVDAFALSSDGLRLLITADTATGAPYAPFFQDVFAAVADGLGDGALDTFLENADDRTGDDKSLLIGVLVP